MTPNIPKLIKIDPIDSGEPVAIQTLEPIIREDKSIKDLVRERPSTRTERRKTTAHNRKAERHNKRVHLLEKIKEQRRLKKLSKRKINPSLKKETDGQETRS